MSCLSKKDLLSLEYLSVIPKDLVNLINNELIIYRFLCSFILKLIRELINLNSKYINTDLLMSDLIRVFESYVENPSFLEKISQILQAHKEIINITMWDAYKKIIDIFLGYEKTYQENIGIYDLVSEVNSILFGTNLFLYLFSSSLPWR